MLSSPYVIPIFTNTVAAGVFVLLVGLVREPHRQRSMAIIAAMGAGTYFLKGELGLWEIPLALAMVAFAYRGLTHYWAIGAAWLMHTLSDVIHHMIGAPLVPSMPLSSFNCGVFDPLIAIWFFVGAPSIFPEGILPWRRQAYRLSGSEG